MNSPGIRASRPAIACHSIEKRFGSQKALNCLSVSIPHGCICGLLGHNGAGKSTLIGLALGQLFADSGRIEIAGHDVAAGRISALAKVGAMYETPAFYEYLSGEKNLRILSEYTAPSTTTRLQEVVRLVGLADRIGDKVSTYSHGMRQRLALAQALLPDPDLLILDEPADGLDPEGIREIRALLLELNRSRGMTIVLSTHILPEVERLCDHVVLLNQGNLVYAGPWPVAAENLRFEIVLGRQKDTAAALAAAGIADKIQDPQVFQLRDGVAPHELSSWLVKQGYELCEMREVSTDLEEFYLAQTRKSPVKREKA